LKSALGLGGLTAVGTLARSPGGLREAYAQMLKSGIAKDSVLARIKEENKLRVGYSQTVPWFQRDPKTGQLSGIYHDVMEELARQLEIKIEYQESSWVNATVGLRKGDFDVFGSSLFYTIPRALVVSYVGPMWSKGRLVLTRKDEASRFKTVADLDNPDVTFSVNVGSAEENWVKVTFPKAKVITTSGQIALSAEPVRTGKADAWASGEEDVMVFAAKNPWAHIIDREHPTDRNPNTWAIRYGDPDWKAFLDMWSQKMVVSDFVKERRQFYLDRVAKSG
jgi:ABC-type amino acid transport substrate-binding protein